ncbi:unnamed protein product, partial [Lymnaea stagnalis]
MQEQSRVPTGNSRTGQSTSRGTHSRPRTSDYYDYHQQRHRAQSPPPPTTDTLGSFVWSTQPSAPYPVMPPPRGPNPASVLRQAPPLHQNNHAPRLTPPRVPVNQQAPPPQPADNALRDDARLVLPDVFLQMIFPHRDTA